MLFLTAFFESVDPSVATRMRWYMAFSLCDFSLGARVVALLDPYQLNWASRWLAFKDAERQSRATACAPRALDRHGRACRMAGVQPPASTAAGALGIVPGD